MSDTTAEFALPPYSHELEWPEGLAPYKVIDEEGTQGDPYAHYAFMRENAPVLRCDTHLGDAWVISRHADIRKGLRKPKIFSNVVNAQEDFAAFLTLVDAPEHTRLRQVVASAFTPASVAAVKDRVRETAVSHLDALVAAGGGEVVEALTRPVTWTTICGVLDIPTQDMERVGAMAEGMLVFFARVRTSAPGNPPHDEQAFRDLMSYLRDHLTRLHAEGRVESVAGKIAQAWLDEGTITEREATELCGFLFQAGFETTTRLMADGFRYLSESPDLLVRIREDEDAAARFVDELARLRGPIHRAFRRATQDFELGGYTIPAGAVVHFLLSSANRDSEVWENGDQLDLDREDLGHFGFGYGVHSCLGAPLARLEVQVVFRLIAERVESVTFDPATDVEMLKGNSVSYGPDWLRVELTPASAS